MAVIILALSILAPPSRYNHRSHGQHVHIVSWVTAGFHCGRDNVMACATRSRPGTCDIWINAKYRAQAYQLIRHEQAHCNGWRH